MGKRQFDPRLKELYRQGKNVYSISKINTINNCLTEAYKTYVAREKGVQSIYGVLGSRVHDVLEAIIHKKADTSELLVALNKELEDADMLGIEFPKDFKGNDTIRNNWVADMEHFCKTFVPPKGEFTTEELILYKINDNRYVQGYIDLIRHNDDGSISIYDWKTSGDFKKKDLIHHGRQLVLYALAKEAEGYKVKNVAWIMLKYAEVSFMGKKRKNSKSLAKIKKIVSRRNLILELKEYLEYDLHELGYDELDIEFMIDKAKKENSLDFMPEEIRMRYTIKPYVRQYEITEELKQECLDYINSAADVFESLDRKDSSQWSHREFETENSKGKRTEDTYFCNALCSHRENCEYIKTYNESKNELDEDEFCFF